MKTKKALAAVLGMTMLSGSFGRISTGRGKGC